MSDMPKSDILVSPLEASLILEVSTRTIARWADDGTLPVYSLTPGGQRRFSRADVEHLASERVVS